MRRSILVLLITLFSIPAFAQDHRVQIHVRGAGLLVSNWTESASQYKGANYLPAITAESYFFVTPRFGAGLTYTYGGNAHVDGAAFLPGPTGIYQHYGVTLMMSTDRTKRFSVYGTVGVLHAEQVFDYHFFRTAKKGLGYSLGFGTALKITRSISFNILELKGISYSKDFAYGTSKSSWAMSFESGLIIKLIREK